MEVIQLDKPDCIRNLHNMDKNTVLALGFFDGIHIGHQKLLRRGKEIALEQNLYSSLLTFKNHPIEVLHPGLCFPYLTTVDEKIHIAKMFGLDYFFIIDFTREFSILSPEAFLNDILRCALRGEIFVVGKDYRFGFAAAGDVDYLKEISSAFAGRVEVVDNVITAYGKVSSNFIRESIMSGRMKRANLNLGYWYSIEGIVKPGKQIGEKLGIPTANLSIPIDKANPRPGVYCVLVMVDKVMYEGICHIGDQPTFNGTDYTIEVHLFRFSGNLYGKKLRVFFLEHVRDTIKFPDAEAMLTQVHADICACIVTLTMYSNEVREKNYYLWVGMNSSS
jgi:riboflavin kinase/FMN adenylyltransferase